MTLNMYTDSTRSKTKVITRLVDDMDNVHFYTCKSSVSFDINQVRAKRKME